VKPEARPVLAPHVRLQKDRITGEPVLLSPESILALNATSHAIVARCDGQRSVEKIIEELALEYEAPIDALRDDVIELLTELHRNNLLILAP
jgi:pyrroloquinoline quinone biosynthesis protein D